MMKRIAIAALALLAGTVSALAQGQPGPGQVMGNSSAAGRPERAENVTAILDRAFGSTRGAILERGASGWAITAPGTVGLPYVSGGAGADGSYAVLGAAGGGTGQTSLAAVTVGVATNTTITDDTATNANMFLTWVTANTGNLPQKVSSTKLFFNPANGRLTVSNNATAFASPGATTGILLLGANSGEARLDIVAANSDGVVGFNRLNGTFAAPTKIVSGNQMMGLPSGGPDTDGSATMQQGGAIGSYAPYDASSPTLYDWSPTSHPTEFRFYTIPRASLSLLLAMKVLDSGGIWVSKNPTATGPVTSGTSSPVIQGQAADGSASTMVYDSFGTNTGSFGIYRNARGTAGSFTATQANDALGGFGWVGATAANTFPNPLPFGAAGGAFILAQASQTWTPAHQGTNLQFYTTADNAAVVAIAMQLNASGGMSVGTQSDAGAGMIYTNAAAFVIRTKTSYTNGAGASAGTITNAPSAGNPTKWIAFDDNGTTRQVPAW